MLSHSRRLSMFLMSLYVAITPLSADSSGEVLFGVMKKTKAKTPGLMFGFGWFLENREVVTKR